MAMMTVEVVSVDVVAMEGMAKKAADVVKVPGGTYHGEGRFDLVYAGGGQAAGGRGSHGWCNGVRPCMVLILFALSCWPLYECGIIYVGFMVRAKKSITLCLLDIKMV